MTSKKREWFIAVCPVGGEYSGNPPSLGVDTVIYGPYTKEQVDTLVLLGEGYPDETDEIVAFTADERPTFRELIKKIKKDIEEAKNRELDYE